MGLGTVRGAEEAVPESEFGRLRDMEKIPVLPRGPPWLQMEGRGCTLKSRKISGAVCGSKGVRNI